LRGGLPVKSLRRASAMACPLHPLRRSTCPKNCLTGRRHCRADWRACDRRPLRGRARRLSFAVLSVMAETSQDEGRQAWLETNGLAARLDLSARLLAKHRGVLAALAAVKGVGG